MWGLILAIIIAIVIAAFASLNSAPVSVNLFFWQAPAISLALVVLFSVLVGVIIAALFGTPQYLKTQQRIRELEDKLKAQKPEDIKEGGLLPHEEKKEQGPS